MTGPGAHLLASLVREGLITAEDLARFSLDAPTPGRTHAEHLPRVLQECPPASLGTYKTNFNRLVNRFPDVALNAVTTGDLAVLAREIEARCVADGGIGVGATASFIHSSRFFYKIGIRDGALAVNPALDLSMPRRRRRVRRALTEVELREVYETVIATSSDVVLDVLLLDFHRETAARRGGAVNLRLRDLNPRRGSMILREKGGHEREVPASRDLIGRVSSVARDRNAVRPDDAAFRFSNGNPLTRRRYNTIFEHVQRELPWADRLGVSAHFLRHTTLSDVAAVAGIRVSAAYAGHGDRTVTDIYTVPTFEDLAEAHRLVFGDI